MESADQIIRVLHVDDERDFLKTTKQILEMQNQFQVETSSSVNEAMQKLGRNSFDVIVSDYQMPEKNGLDFLNQVRENGNNIPFILFTGRGREEVAIKALNLGADYYINKTGHPETVYPQLSHYILQAVQKRKAEERLRYKVDFESIIVRISSRFVNPADLDKAINKSLADIGKISGASRVYIFFLQKNGTMLDNTHEWCIEGVTSQIGNLKNLPLEVAPWWMKQLRDGKIIQISDVTLMPPEAKAEKEILESQDIKSVVVLPITVSGELAGFIGLDNVTKTGAWSYDDVALLQIVSELIGTTLERKKSEEMYRTLFENTGTAMCILEEDKTISMVNRRFEELSGYSREEVEGKKWTNFVTEEHSERMQRYHEARRDSGEKPPTHYSFDFVNKKGQARTGLLTIELIPGTNQSVASILDITDRKKTEEKLKESEKEYRLLTENTTDVIFIQDMDLRITYASPSVEKLSGYTPEEVLKLKIEDMMTPESFERGVVSFKEAISLATKKPDYEIPLMQYEYVRKDGSTFWGELKVKFLRNSIGRLLGIQGTLRDITERKKAEDALRQEREMLELVTANIGAGLTIISKDYKILWANKFLRNFLGDVKGKTCYSVYNDRTSVCPGCGVKEIFETGKDHIVHEQLVPAPNGQRAWIEITANPIKDEKGNIIAASELSVYLNERKEMERKLREAEKRYHALFNKAPLGILIIDSKGNAVEFNDEAHRQLGYSRKEFAKLNVSDYEVLESPAETRARMKNILEAGKDEFESKHRAKSGEIRDIINTVQVIELDGKRFFTVITRDITEQKKAEERLMENEEKYREIINAMNDTAWVIDFDGAFIDANDAAVKVLGYSRKELLSMGVKDIDFNFDQEEIKDFVKAMLTGEKQVLETIHITKDGKKIPVEISSSLVTYKGNQAILSIARDITERKLAEESLDKIMKELVMINEKLGVVGKLTRHDARNKLSVIINNVYLAKKQLTNNPNASEYLDAVESAVDQMEKIFSFARTYEMLGAEELSDVTVKNCVNEAVSLFSGMNGITVVNECSGLTVLADSLLRQLFYNLIDNSMKYGEKVSQIRVYYEEGEDWLKLIYEDNGIGIPKAEKEKIFMERYGKGTGYGLYLIRKICEAYGWTIKETGTSGKGAQFTMTIPKIWTKTKN